MFTFTLTRLILGVVTLAVLVILYRRVRSLLHMIRADIAEVRIDNVLGAGRRPPQKPSSRRRGGHLRSVPSAGSRRPRASLGAGWLRRYRGPGLVGPLIGAAVVSATAYIGSTAERAALAPVPAPSVSLVPQPGDKPGPGDLVRWQARSSAPQPSPSKPSTKPSAKTPASPAGRGAGAAPSEPTPTEDARSAEPSPSVPSTTPPPPPEDTPAPSSEPKQCEGLTLEGILGDCGLGLDVELGLGLDGVLGLTEEGR